MCPYGIQVGNNTVNVPLIETWQVGRNKVRVQYDSGATITLIGAKTLTKFPADSYKLGQNRRIMCSTYVGSKASYEMVQDAEVTFMGKTFLALVIKEDLEDVERMEVQIPRRWRTAMNSGSLVIGGKIDILAGGNMGRLFPDQEDRFEDMKLFISNFTNKAMIFGYQGRGDLPNRALAKKFACATEIETNLSRSIRKDEYGYPEDKDKRTNKDEIQDKVQEENRTDPRTRLRGGTRTGPRMRPRTRSKERIRTGPRTRLRGGTGTRTRTRSRRRTQEPTRTYQRESRSKRSRTGPRTR